MNIPIVEPGRSRHRVPTWTNSRLGHFEVQGNLKVTATSLDDEAALNAINFQVAKVASGEWALKWDDFRDLINLFRPKTAKTVFDTADVPAAITVPLETYFGTPTAIECYGVPMYVAYAYGRNNHASAADASGTITPSSQADISCYLRYNNHIYSGNTYPPNWMRDTTNSHYYIYNTSNLSTNFSEEFWDVCNTSEIRGYANYGAYLLCGASYTSLTAATSAEQPASASFTISAI